jgi:transcriptional regulator with XRE-family HTH domain
VEEELRSIAGRVRKWRLEGGMTLQELGGRAGVSASTIHKIENCQTVPTVGVLVKVARGLRRSPAELFDGERDAASARHVRAKDRSILQANVGTELHRIVGGVPDAMMDLWRVVHEPEHGAGLDEPLSYEGELIIYVESGVLTVDVGEEHFVLERGDTLHFKTSFPHRWINSGETSVSCLFFGSLNKRPASRPTEEA